MKLRATILGTSTAALLVLAAAPLLLAQPPGGGPRGMHGHGRDQAHRLFEYLELDGEQREAWIEAHRAHGQSLKPTFEQIRDLREQMKAELEGGSPDPASVGGYLIAIHQLEAELASSREELEATIRGILDDEQERKLEAFKAANHGPRHGPASSGHRWRGPRSGGPGAGASGPSR
ncbi:MAG TPA: periplasmic heavy metal sensor [Thermoanaerobaculia bacterium]|nr:periplasmic heavy metal sensor [Thermoanaerobaculia bacterium]